MVAVSANIPAVPEKLHNGRLNISSSRERSGFASYLARRADDKDNTDAWLAIIERFCTLVLDSEMEGQPFELVGSRPTRTREEYRVYPILRDGKPHLLYGAGGSCKSFTALAMALSVVTGHPIIPGFKPQQGNALYLDWETDADDMDERVKELCAGAGLAPVDMPYRRCSGTLADQAEEVARYVDEHQVKLIVVDSVEMASSGGERYGDANEPIIRFFSALRIIGCTSLAVDHINREDTKTKATVQEAYGTIYKANLARAQYYLRRAKENSGDGMVHIGLYDSKRNKGAGLAPIGLALQFAEGSLTYYRESIDQTDLVNALPLDERIWWALREPANTLSLSDTLGEKESAIRTILARRSPSKFVTLSDGKWARADYAPPSTNGHGNVKPAASWEEEELPF